MSKKTLIILIVIIIIAIGGFVIWRFFLPTTDNQMPAEERSEKETLFQSEKYGFEIRYPQDWVIFEETEIEDPDDRYKEFYKLTLWKDGGDYFGQVSIIYQLAEGGAVFSRGTLLENKMYILDMAFSQSGVIVDSIKGKRGTSKLGPNTTDIMEVFLDKAGEGVFVIAGLSENQEGSDRYTKETKRVVDSFRFLQN